MDNISQLHIKTNRLLRSLLISLVSIPGKFEVNRIGQDAANPAEHRQQRARSARPHDFREEGGDGDAGDEMRNTLHLTVS